MNILLVDDSKGKIRKVKQCLAASGLSEDNIDVALCIIDAKKRLAEKVFDLLILDVAVPIRHEDEPHESAGPDLLREIIERDHLNNPRYIVGLTAYPELFDRYAGEFGDHMWNIIQFRQEENGWCDGITSLLNHMKVLDSNERAREYQYDLAIVTTLPDPEFAAIRNLGWGLERCSMSGDPGEFYTGKIVLKGGGELSVIAAVANRMGMVSTSILATKVIEYFCPRFLVMTGICAGVRGRCELGDVIVADPVWNYQSGKRLANSKSLLIDPHQLPIRNAIRRRFNLVSENSSLLNRLKSEWQGNKPTTEIGVHVGPMASGSQVLADSECIKEILLQQRKLIGVEMEIYGLYAAADEARSPQPNCFALKSVCDFADDEKSDDYQRYAAYTSAKVLEMFAMEHIPDLKKII